jgi:hypothetical protein
VYAAHVSGTYSLDVRTGGYSISGSPFTVVCEPPQTSGRLSTCIGDGLSGAVSGKPSYFTIEARDFAGEEQRTGSDPYMLTFPDLTPQNCAISVEDCHNGQYLATFVCTKSTTGSTGTAMHVTLKGDHVKGSPFDVAVLPDAVSGEACVAYGDGLRYAVAGLQAMFTIEGRDTFENLCQVRCCARPFFGLFVI